MFGRNLLKIAAVGAALVLGASAALAAPVTLVFTFSGTDLQGPVLNYTSGGVNLAVTGHLYTAPDTINANVQVNQQQVNGLGVCGTLLATDTTGNCASPQLDGGSRRSTTNNELLKFTFSQIVSLLSVEFNQNDTNDRLDFFVGEPLDYISSANAPAPSTKVLSLANLFSSLSVFGIGLQDHSDEVRIAKLTVSYDAPVLPPVPVPAAGLLLLGALGGLAALRRRRTA